MKVIRASAASPANMLMVTNMWPYEDHDGYGIFVKRQIDSLGALGLDYDVLFIEGYRTKWEYVRAASYMFRLNWSEHRPALVHSHGGETAVSVRWYVRGKVLLSYCGSDLLGSSRPDGRPMRRSHPRRFFFRQIARLMSATITKSDEMQAKLPSGCRAHNAVVPNGVDRSLFRPIPTGQARRQLGWPDDQRIVLFAANPARPVKRYWLAKAACDEARRMVGRVELMVAADLTPDLLPIYMAAADCLLLTSSTEGSPNVVKEAMACGLPVVSTDAGDVRELLQTVEPSWVCAPDPSELAAAVAECLTTRQRSDGRERSRWLDQDLIAAELVALYRELVPELAETLPDTVAVRRVTGESDSALPDDAPTPTAFPGGAFETIRT